MELVDVAAGDDDLIIFTSYRTKYILKFWASSNRAQYVGFKEAPIFRVPYLDHYLKTKFI